MTTPVVRPLPGPGLVARAGDFLLVCADGTSGAEELLDLLAEVAEAGDDGSVLVRRVAALLAADFAGRYPACAVSGPTTDGRLAVLAHGSALATVVGTDGEVTLSAADAITSVNRLVPGPISSIRLELPGAGAANRLSRLGSGVVAAAGIIAEYGLIVGTGPAIPASARVSAPAHDPAPAPEPVQDTAPVQEAAPIQGTVPAQAGAPAVETASSSTMDDGPSLAAAGDPPVPFPFTMSPPAAPPPFRTPGPADVAADPPAPPLTNGAGAPDQVLAPSRVDGVAAPEAPSLREPDVAAAFVSVGLATNVDTSAPPPAPVADARPLVLGLACPHGHLNDPSSDTCITCGASMAGQPPVLQEGPRPPLGALLLDDGSTYVLDADYVLGREPQQDPEVVAGTVRPLKIVDAEGVVSRKHARVALVGWEIQVVDLGSANGTFVQYPGDPQGHPLVAHQPIVVRPGTQITMGRRWFRVEALSPQPPRPA